MEKFGLFDLIDKLTTPNATNQTPNQTTIAPPQNEKTKSKTAKQSASLFLLRHAELSRKIDSKLKK